MDIIYTLIGYYLPINDINMLCINKESYNTYKDNNFWNIKFTLDYIDHVDYFVQLEKLKWKENYKVTTNALMNANNYIFKLNEFEIYDEAYNYDLGIDHGCEVYNIIIDEITIMRNVSTNDKIDIDKLRSHTNYEIIDDAIYYMEEKALCKFITFSILQQKNIHGFHFTCEMYMDD